MSKLERFYSEEMIKFLVLKKCFNVLSMRKGYFEL